MRRIVSATRLLLAAGALMMLGGVKAAQADFIDGAIKILDCPPGPTCIFPVTQQFIIDPNNDFTVIKDIFVQPQPPIIAFHVAAGLWPEKDLKHMGFRCLDINCIDITGFDPSVDFANPIFDVNIGDLHGLTAVGIFEPDVKFVSPSEAIAWLPDRQIFRDFFATRNVVDFGQVAVLFAHIPAPGTVTLFVLGLLGLGAAGRRRTA